MNLQNTINSIATIERAIVTPSPGIVTSYGFGANPVEITNPALLPAVVHIERGPQTIYGAAGSVDRRFYYEIDSLALLIEALPDGYPADSAAVAQLWEAIAAAFTNEINRATLADAAECPEYACVFQPQSYKLRRWPPEPLNDYRVYWSLLYTHRFTVLL